MIDTFVFGVLELGTAAALWLLLDVAWASSWSSPADKDLTAYLEWALLVSLLSIWVFLPSPILVSYLCDVIFARVLGGSVGKRIMWLRVVRVQGDFPLDMPQASQHRVCSEQFHIWPSAARSWIARRFPQTFGSQARPKPIPAPAVGANRADVATIWTLTLRWLLLIAPNAMLFRLGIHYFVFRFGWSPNHSADPWAPFSILYPSSANFGLVYLAVGGAYLAILIATVAGSSRYQGLHDRVARTVVVDARPVPGAG